MRACVRACAPPSSAYYESTWKRDGEEADRGGKVDPVSRTCSPCAPVFANCRGIPSVRSRFSLADRSSITALQRHTIPSDGQRFFSN